jgi:hypothetical protein
MWWCNESPAWSDSRGDRPDDQRWLIDLGQWASSAGASCWMVDLISLDTARVAGLVERLRIDPLAGDLDALITDGTERVIARWGTGPPTPQLAVAPGRLVVVEGLVVSGDDGMMMIVEPTFEVFGSAWRCVSR